MKIEFIEWEDEDGHHAQVIMVVAQFDHENESVARQAAEDFADTLDRIGGLTLAKPIDIP